MGSSPGEAKGYPLQYSALENSTDCIVNSVAKSWDTTELFSRSGGTERKGEEHRVGIGAGFSDGSGSRESACSAGDLSSAPRLGRSPGRGHGNTGGPPPVGSIPGSGRFPGKGNGNPLQYSCQERSYRQRSLMGYSPWDCKESDMTEQLTIECAICF